MKYEEKKVLACRGPLDSLPDEAVPGILLVGESAIHEWHENQSQCGEDKCRIFPAIHEGKRAWLIHRSWRPAYGYLASGSEEELISFELGVSMLIEMGAYAYMWPDGSPGLSRSRMGN